MCGIISIAGKNSGKIDDKSIGEMLASLSNRGPDDKGMIRTEGAVLGQTRLSIIDLSGGHQPMKDNTRPHTIVFNGEIYNYRELREELKSKGHKFSTESDTEVILKTYIEYGEECPKYLDGMFAFAIWDGEASALFMARDRFGKKPLYYAFDENSTIYAASEIKALLKAGIRGEIDYKAIDNYLTLMYVPPWKSVYKNIMVLPPAHFGFYKNGKLKVSRYWSIPERPVKATYDEAKEEIKRLFDESVKKRMVADVEVGALLSGGVDSTLVCSYAQKHTSRPLKTFSVSYGEYINELPFAREASKKIGSEHFSLEAGGDLTQELEKITEYMDEPHADSSNFPQHMVSGLASSKVKVALSGDGADELFMGYGWYWKYRNLRKIEQIKNFFSSNPFKEHIKNISVFKENERKSLWKNPDNINKDIVGQSASSRKKGDVKKINLFDLTTYLPGQLLAKIDRTSMMHSLEVRSPFLDRELAEYVYNLPLHYKMNNKGGKIILKDILSEIMPKEFVYRRKQGFGAPVSAWLKEEKMKVYVTEKLGSGAMIYGFLKKEAVDAYLSRFYEKGEEGVHYKIWVLLCLELWLRSRK